MRHSAIVTFTAKPLRQIVEEGGSRDWRLDPRRARQAEYLVCTQNTRNPDPVDPRFGPPRAAHAVAFLIGRVSDVVPSPRDPNRWLIRISEYTSANIPNIWGKSGHLRYPVWYTSLEELGIDLSTLPPLVPLKMDAPNSELAEAPTALLVPPRSWTAERGQPRSDQSGESEARFDAILSQLDRVPDLPVPLNPLDWDEHGLPR